MKTGKEERNSYLTKQEDKLKRISTVFLKNMIILILKNALICRRKNKLENF